MVEESLSKMEITLNNGNKMPAFGLGTYKIREPQVIEAAVDAALKAGYRLFDSAAVYGNEAALGEAFRKLLPKYNLEREDIFITTKLSPVDHGDYEVVESAYKKSLSNLGVEYVDLYLIHFPGSVRLAPSDARNPELRRKTWKALNELYDEGRVNSIGVANFTVRHLQDLNIRAGGVFPVVNQVEWHPYFHQTELRDYCRKNDICLQAYGSLGGASSGDKALLEEPLVKEIAEGHKSGAAQVLLAWALQQDVAVIPKSATPARIRDNICIDFKLTEAEINKLNALGGNAKKYAWDPKEMCTNIRRNQRV
ncbi:unnamed protein product, partial [Iphiclides podalirius]